MVFWQGGWKGMRRSGVQLLLLLLLLLLLRTTTAATAHQSMNQNAKPAMPKGHSRPCSTRALVWSAATTTIIEMLGSDIVPPGSISANGSRMLIQHLSSTHVWIIAYS